MEHLAEGGFIHPESFFVFFSGRFVQDEMKFEILPRDT